MGGGGGGYKVTNMRHSVSHKAEDMTEILVLIKLEGIGTKELIETECQCQTYNVCSRNQTCVVNIMLKVISQF